jgi:hypothetical protein
MRFLLFAVIALSLALVGCGKITPASLNGKEEAKSNNGAQSEISRVEEKTPSPEVDKINVMAPQEKVSAGRVVKFVSYENKAIGYIIDRPDKWYWQHYLRREIGESYPLVDDYFIADPKPLEGLNKEPLGQIIIEVSKRDLKDISDLDSRLQGLKQAEVTVGGLEATRYQGLEGQLNRTVIEYRFFKGARSFRIIYDKINSSEADEEAFEKVVGSLKFKDVK